MRLYRVLRYLESGGSVPIGLSPTGSVIYSPGRSLMVADRRDAEAIMRAANTQLARMEGQRGLVVQELTEVKARDVLRMEADG